MKGSTGEVRRHYTPLRQENSAGTEGNRKSGRQRCCMARQHELRNRVSDQLTPPSRNLAVALAFASCRRKSTSGSVARPWALFALRRGRPEGHQCNSYTLLHAASPGGGPPGCLSYCPCQPLQKPLQAARNASKKALQLQWVKRGKSDPRRPHQPARRRSVAETNRTHDHRANASPSDQLPVADRSGARRAGAARGARSRRPALCDRRHAGACRACQARRSRRPDCAPVRARRPRAHPRSGRERRPDRRRRDEPEFMAWCIAIPIGC